MALQPLPEPVNVFDVVGPATSHPTRLRYAAAYADHEGTADDLYADPTPTSADFDLHVDQALALVREA